MCMYLPVLAASGYPLLASWDTCRKCPRKDHKVIFLSETKMGCLQSKESTNPGVRSRDVDKQQDLISKAKVIDH